MNDFYAKLLIDYMNDLYKLDNLDKVKSIFDLEIIKRFSILLN